MRFLIDVTDLRSPSRNKYKRVLERFLTEISNGKGVAVEIAEGEGRIMAACLDKRQDVDIWSSFPQVKSIPLMYWSRIFRVIIFYLCSKLAHKILSRSLIDGVVWSFVYSIEFFSVPARQRIARTIGIHSDTKRLSLFHYWLRERGFVLNDQTIARSEEFDTSRAILCNAHDVLVLAGTSWCRNNSALIKSKNITGFKLVCLIYDVLPIDYPSFVTVRQREQYKKFLCDMGITADLILTPNAFTAMRLTSFFADRQMYPAAITPISLWAACLRKNTGKITQRLMDIGLLKQKYMLCVANLRERKHVLWLYALCVKLCQDQPKLPVLVLAGGVIDPEILLTLSHDPMWGKVSVFIADPTEAELSWLYENTELCLQPSFEGGLGMAVREAVVYRKHCIAADAPSLMEASEGRAEHLPRDEILWANAIQEALNLIDRTSDEKRMKTWIDSSLSILPQIELLLTSRN